MMPEPEPDSCAPVTSILTTEGSTCWATCSTEPWAAVPVGALTTGDVVRAAGAAVELGGVGVPGVPGRGATDAGRPTDEQGGGHHARGEPAATGAATACGAAGAGAPAGRRDVSFMSATMPRAPVTRLRRCWACGKKPPARRLRRGPAGRLWPRVGSDTITGMTAPEPRFVDDRLAHWAAETPGRGGDDLPVPHAGPGRSGTSGYAAPPAALRALGIGRGDVVAFLDKNHPACVELSLAAGSLGAANAIVNWRSAGDEVEYAVNDSGARVLVVGSELMPHGRADPRPAHPASSRSSR